MRNVDRDIMVIGAGGCGLMAALVAAKKGVRVLLLEKTDKPGGGTAFSSKGIRAAASRRQHEFKIDDSAALYAQDILRRKPLWLNNLLQKTERVFRRSRLLVRHPWQRCLQPLPMKFPIQRGI